ncbi:hypothetical protein [Halocalculus aciditolerans]|uniref:Uncharacterized protein n=1 Tax=Halocalculus aciditolerans TaxID=1383812 RepID=A0A830FNR9_9EURY|nr:hypothetical protein [Halocalculus aciditolerans]GGL73640.1 hypothetical protein GCM10009039_34670 [Halocalculus aciditolerans]
MKRTTRHDTTQTHRSSRLTAALNAVDDARDRAADHSNRPSCRDGLTNTLSQARSDIVVATMADEEVRAQRLNNAFSRLRAASENNDVPFDVVHRLREARQLLLAEPEVNA